MYETWERQKAITNSRHMQEVQHRIDSEYQVLNQASLRRKEYERELIEKKREHQISKQKRRWLTLSSIYSTRSYDRPWASGTGTNRQLSVAGLSEARLNTNSKKPAAKLPAIASSLDRNKFKPTNILKNKGLSIDTVNPAMQPQILSKRTRLHQRRLPERSALPRTQAPRDGEGPTSSLPQKTPDTEATGLGGSKIYAGSSDSVNRNNYGKKTTSHFSQQNRDPKASEGTIRSRGSVLQSQNSTAPASLTLGSHAASDPSLIQSSRHPRTPPNSYGVSGSSSNLLSGSSHESPRTSVFNSSFLTLTSGTPQDSPTTPKANHSPWSPESGFSYAQPELPVTNSASVSQLHEPTHTPRSTSTVSGFSRSLSSGQYHTPPRSIETVSTPIQLSGLSHTQPQPMTSRTSVFRFQEEDFYHSLNTAIGTEDTIDNYLSDDELYIGTPTLPSTSNVNRIPFQTTFSQVTSSDTGRGLQDTMNGRRVELANGTSTQFNTVPISEIHTFTGHEGERPWRSPRIDDLESYNFGPPATSGVRFHCGEGAAVAVGDNGRRHESGHSASPISIGVSPARPTNGAQGAHSSFSTPRPLMSSPPREVALLMSMVDTSSLEVADMEGNPRSNTSGRPLSPIGSRLSFTSARSHDPLLDTSAAPEVGSPRQGRHGGSRFLSSFPMTPIHQGYEDVPLNSEASHPPSYHSSLHLNVTQESPARSSLQENIPLALLTMSDLHPMLSRITLVPPAAPKETSKPKADPEKLRRLKESLLEEDSEEEGDLCRICLSSGDTPDNSLIEPCGCGGSLQFVHKECLTKWLKAKITSGAELEAVKRCELCRQNLQCDLGDFNLDGFYNTHQQSQGQSERMNSGLYLMLLLHLYEQRYAELLRLTHSRARRDRNSSEYIPVEELSTFRALFRNYGQIRAEANENSESGGSGEDSE